MYFTKFELKQQQYSKLELVQNYIFSSYYLCFKEKNYICGDDFYKFFDYLDENLFIYLKNNFNDIQKDINAVLLKEKIKYKKEYIVNEFNKKLESVQIGEFIQESVLYNYHEKYTQNIDNDLHSHISFFIDSYSNDIENKTIQTGGGLDKIINADITQNGYLLEFKKDLGCFETEISSASKNLIFNINCNHVFFKLLFDEIKKKICLYFRY